MDEVEEDVKNKSFGVTTITKIRRGPKLEGCAFANFGNSSGTEGELRQK